MFDTNIAKINYSRKNETLGLIVSTEDAYSEIVITTNDVTNANYGDTAHETLMSELFYMLGYEYSLDTTVAKKYRDADNIAKAAYFDEPETPNSPEEDNEEYFNNEKYFNLFLDAIDGKEKVTPGKFMLTKTIDGETTYWNDPAGKARIFKSREEARVIAYYNAYEVVEVS